MSLAIVFPGQGSQSVGMMQGFADLPIVEKTFLEANAILGVDLWTMVREGPAEALNQTVNTQPVMLVAGVACWRAWREKSGPMPSWLAGHSLGEYSALVAAESMRFEDALPLVRFRAQAMQEAVPEGIGGIAAILGLDETALKDVCAEAAQGEVLAVEVKKPLVPVIHNRFVESFDDPARIRQALVEQLCNPVRWIETIEFLGHKGVRRVVECGPGKVLTGLSKRIVPDIEYIALNDAATLAAASAQV